MASSAKPRRDSSVDDAEVARFSALASEWWDPRGKMAVLHKFNPVRLGFIKDAACGQFEREPNGSMRCQVCACSTSAAAAAF